jgi:hypothetical protein
MHLQLCTPPLSFKPSSFYSPGPLDIIVRKGYHGRVLVELACALLPSGPCLGSAQRDGVILVRQEAVVRRDEVVALVGLNGVAVLLERVGPDVLIPSAHASASNQLNYTLDSRLAPSW